MEGGQRSRGYLPHVEGQSLTQFLTWHLADALPPDAVVKIQKTIAELPEGERRITLSRLVERYCDAGFGACSLADPRAARIFQEKVFELDGRFFDLHAWAVMPNHTHLLLTPKASHSLAEIAQRIKGGSSREINAVLSRTGRLWQPEVFDTWIRNGSHFENVRRYIEWNPVKAKLVQDPSLFPWSSASEAARKRLEILREERSPSDRRL